LTNINLFDVLQKRTCCARSKKHKKRQLKHENVKISTDKPRA